MMTPASDESHGGVKQKDACASSIPASPRANTKLLYPLLLLVLGIFSVSVIPGGMMTAHTLGFSQKRELESGLQVDKVKRDKYLFRQSESLTSETRGHQLQSHQSVDKATGHESFQSTLLDSESTELISNILVSNPKHKNQSATDYAMNLRFGYVNWTDGKPLFKDPIPYQPDRKSLHQIREFLSRKSLMATPLDTDGLSPYLKTAEEVIEEAKRVHFNLFRDLFRGKKYAVLFELAAFENKGDAALTVSEIMMLEHLGIELVYYVNLKKCWTAGVERAIKVAGRYPRDEVVVLLHGGGNIIAHANLDHCRERSIRMSRGYQQVFFSNSIWMRETKKEFDFSTKLYCCNSNLTMLLRDRRSLYIAQRIFSNRTRLVLAPDMAFHIGHVPRYSPPYYDVIWQKRTDHENNLFDKVPEFPPNVTVYVWDWIEMKSIPNDNSLKKAVNVMNNGFGILQMGRVVVTDRLHGHILSTLLDIPHVLLDNADQKLSSYHNTWTRGLSNCRLADNAEEAARLALELLEEYNDSLPRRLRAADINENL